MEFSDSRLMTFCSKEIQQQLEILQNTPQSVYVPIL